MHNQSRRDRAVGARLGDAVLTVAALAGGLSIVLVILAFTMNVSIMMFRTGSMEPTIPTGSIAFVREIPATEMAEGDIITVDRGEDLLPVTHRVTDIQSVDESSGVVTFVMQGDANETADPEPYTASTVQRTIFSIRGIAPAIQSLQSPYVLGGLTLGAAALVIWAFWPRDKAPVRRTGGAHAANGVVLPVVLALTLPVLAQQNIVPTPENLTTEKIIGEYIQLQTTSNRDKMSNMVPGEPVTWAVDVGIEAPQPGQVDLALAAAGPMAAQPDALTTEVQLCTPHPTALMQCHPDAEIERKIIDTTRLVDDESDVLLGSMDSDETRRVLITTTLADPPPKGIQATGAELQFTATGYGEELSVGARPGKAENSSAPLTSSFDLADTGFVAGWLIVVGLLLIITGLLMLGRRSAGNRKHSQDGAFCA